MTISYHSPSECGQSSSSKPHPFKIDRRFDPTAIYGKEFDLNALDYRTGFSTAVPCPLSAHKCTDCKKLSPHVGALIIAIDGACRSTPSVWGPSSIGVFFAKDSPWNIVKRSSKPAAVSQRAELQACLAALQMAVTIKVEKLEEELTQIVIKAHSEYVCRGMTEWVGKWKKTGWLNAKGIPVANGDLFQDVEKVILRLNEMGVEVLFWQVVRERNVEAEGLASSAFEGVRKP